MSPEEVRAPARLSVWRRAADACVNAAVITGVALAAFTKASTWRLALRNVGRNPRRTIIVLSAVVVGLAGMLIAMSVNYGMIVQMVETAIRTELGHVQVHGDGWNHKPAIEIRVDADALELDAVPGVQAWAPRVRGQGLLYSPRASVGVRVLGIDPAREARVSSIAASITEGEYLNGVARRVLVGERLGRRLHVGIGDKVVLSAQDLDGEMTGEAFRIGGFYRTASRELDESAVILRLAESQHLYGLDGQVSEVAFKAADQRQADALKADLAARLPSQLEVETWKELRPFLVQMIDMFERVGWVSYAAIFVAMAFGIANVLLMSVFERTREIGILTAIGMPPGRMLAIVVAESLVLTLLGVGLGLGLGVLGVWGFSDGIDLSRWGEGLVAFGIPMRIVPVLRLGDLVVPVAIAVITALLASLWPALRALRTRPAEAIRHV